MDSHGICLETVNHCLTLGGKHAEALHVRTMLDCAEICATVASLLLRGSEFYARMSSVCAEVCAACAESCESIDAHDKIMQQCAEICRRCATSCRRMAASRESTRCRAACT